MIKYFLLEGQRIDVLEVSPGLYLPVTLEDSRNLDAIIAAAQCLYDALPPAAKETPWIIGSTDKDILGNPRSKSESHMKGLAFDVSPCAFNEEGSELIPAGRVFMGLAWNVASLALVAPAAKAVPFVVEGDHLHCMVHGQPTGDIVFSVPTMSTWYPATTTVEGSPELTPLLNRVFVYSEYSFAPATREAFSEFLSLVDSK